jgi:hypothetical protein
VVEIAALARDQVVRHPDAVATPYQLFREMGTDEPGTAGHEIRSHIAEPLARADPD